MKKIWLVPLLIIVNFLPILTEDPDPVGSRIRQVEKNLLPPVLVDGDPAYTLEERMKHYKIPGIGIAVFKNFQVEWAKGYGVRSAESYRPVTVQTLFQAASISKPVAAATALHLVEAGKLPLNEDINHLLKTWKLPEIPLMAEEKVTLERILSHSAGLTVHGFPGYHPDKPLPTVVQILDGQKPANTAPIRVDITPGSRYRYSGGGITLMQFLLTEVTGLPFDRLAAATVLTPIGMNNSSYQQPLPSKLLEGAASGHLRDGKQIPGGYHIYPEMAAAGLWTTPRDLSVFAIEIQKSLLGKSNKILSREMTRRMLEPVSDVGNGLGFFIDQERTGYFGHGGANEGFRCQLVAHLENGQGAVVMVNSDNGAIIPEILRGIAKVYGWQNFLPPVHKTIPLTDTMKTELPGRYLEDGDHVIDISQKDGRLFLRRTYYDAVEIHPVAEKRFIRKDRNQIYEWVKNEETGTDSLTIHTGSRRVTCRPVGADHMVPGEWLLEARYPEALTAYRQLREEDPSNPLVSASRLSAIFNHFHTRKQVLPLLFILRLNADWYPQMIIQYEKPLKKEIDSLLNDKTIPEADREMLKQKFESIISKVSKREKETDKE